MADKTAVHFSVKAYTELLQMGKDTKEAAVLREQQSKAREGAYTHAVRAAVICRDEAKGDAGAHYMLLDHTFRKLDQAIGFNVDQAAVLFGAKLLKKPAKNGSTYAIPSNVASAKSQLLTAVKNGTELTYADKDGKETMLSFTKVREINDAKREQADAVSALQLTGKPAAVFRATRALTVALTKIGEMEEAALKELTGHVMAVTGIKDSELLPKIPDTQPAPKAEATVAASAPSKPAPKKSKKAPKGAGDMIEDEQKKAA